MRVCSLMLSVLAVMFAVAMPAAASTTTYYEDSDGGMSYTGSWTQGVTTCTTGRTVRHGSTVARATGFASADVTLTFTTSGASSVYFGMCGYYASDTAVGVTVDGVSQGSITSRPADNPCFCSEAVESAGYAIAAAGSHTAGLVHTGQEYEFDYIRVVDSAAGVAGVFFGVIGQTVVLLLIVAAVLELVSAGFRNGFAL